MGLTRTPFFPKWHGARVAYLAKVTGVPSKTQKAAAG